MVFYFTSNVVEPNALIYMGKDKYENEDLIKYGCDEDVWFHVDKLSSAHVYLRLSPGQQWDSLDDILLMDCAQLVKYNSIEGNKKDNITVVYTPWSNLKKSKAMETGQVAFKSEKKVKKIFVKTRDNSIVNRLNKTKVEKIVDYAQEAVERQKSKSKVQREVYNQTLQQELETQRLRKAEKEARSYTNVFKEELMMSNVDAVKAYIDPLTGEVDSTAFEEDFM